MKWLVLIAVLFCWAVWADTLPDEVINCLGANPCSTVSGAPSNTYYVDCAAGDNTKTGLSHAQRWRTLTKANNTIATDGADLYLLDNTSCSGQTLTIDWVGSSTNHIKVSTYRMVAGVETPGASSAATRARIRGTYNSSCSQALGAAAPATCLMSTTGAVPSNQFNPMIQVSADYVDISDLIVMESAGTGINITGNHHLTIDNVKIDTTASLAIFPRNTQYLTVRNSEFVYAAIASSRGDNLYSGGPHAISHQNSRPAYALYENNYFHEIFGEGINCRTSSFCVFRGNRFANVRTAAVYLDNTSDSLVENNEIYGQTVAVPSGSVGSAWSVTPSGISIAVEETSNPRYHTVRNTVRNNLIANVNNCININVFPTVEAEGWTTGGQIIGNTCLAYTNRAVNMSDPAANIAGWEIADNIFDRPNNGGAALCSSTNGATQMNFHHNAWSAVPGDADCRTPGTGDVTGASGVSTTFGWTTAGQNNYPAAADWELTGHGTAVAASAGVAMTGAISPAGATWLQFPSFSGLQQSGNTCNPTLAIWGQQLGTDHDCVTRGATPDAGAKEN